MRFFAYRIHVHQIGGRGRTALDACVFCNVNSLGLRNFHKLYAAIEDVVRWIDLFTSPWS